MEEEAHLVGHLLIATGVVLPVLHEDGLVVPVLGRGERWRGGGQREEKGGGRERRKERGGGREEGGRRKGEVRGGRGKAWREEQVIS